MDVLYRGVDYVGNLARHVAEEANANVVQIIDTFMSRLIQLAKISFWVSTFFLISVTTCIVAFWISQSRNDQYIIEEILYAISEIKKVQPSTSLITITTCPYITPTNF